MGARQSPKENRAQGARGIAYLAGGLVAAFLLSGCELVEQLTEDPPPKKAAAAESEAVEADAAESEAAEAEAEAEPATPVASVTPSDDPRLILRVPFETGKADLPEESEAALTVLAGWIPGNPSATPEIYAYWNAASEDPNQAKTFSLKRGMVVRTFLKERGANVPRIYLQPVDDPDPNLIDLLRPLP
jgi:outer membrane protein OmpA-like peptidoglycan-associated protein